MRNIIISNLVILICKRHKISKLPVQIARVAESYSVLKNMDIPFDIDGVVIADKISKTIIINNSINRNRRRFTLAHELGHVLIPWHTGVIIEDASDVDLDWQLQSRDIEREANQFAAEILLPEVVIKKYISDGLPNIAQIVERIAHDGIVSVLATVFRIFEILPRGFAYIIVNANSSVEYSGKSSSTVVSLQDKGMSFDDSFIDSAFSRTVLAKSDYTYHFYQLKTDKRKRKGKNIDWRTIIKEILDDKVNKEYHIQILRSLNGVIGAFNSNENCNDLSYPMYLDQLVAAIQSHKNLLPIYSDNRFSEYVKRKANSLYKK